MTRKINYYLDDNDRNQANSFQNFYNSVYKTLNKNLTITGLVFACINISLGVFLAVFDWYWQLIWYFVLGIIVAIYIILEANKYFGKLNAHKQAEQNSKNSSNYLYGSARSSLGGKDARSNTSSYIYNRDDISMDYLESSSQQQASTSVSQQQQQPKQTSTNPGQQRQRQNSGSTCYSNNINITSSSRVATIQNDYSLRRPTTAVHQHNVSFRDDDSYISNREFIQTGVVTGGPCKRQPPISYS